MTSAGSNFRVARVLLPAYVSKFIKYLQLQLWSQIKKVQEFHHFCYTLHQIALGWGLFPETFGCDKWPNQLFRFSL